MREKITLAMMAKTPVHQQQQHHHDEGNNPSLTTSDNGDDTSSTIAETHLRINDSNNAIMMRATITIATMKMPAH
jgi:hypothetical protein